MSTEVTLDARTAKGLRRSVVAGSIGVFVHWFDWAIYAYLASTIAKVFFPEEDQTASLLSVFAVLAVAFFVRPIGSVIFGYIGDKYGRKRTLTIVIIAMAAGTVLLGLIPSFAQIGIWSPILLIVSRIIQGLAAGGEFGSAAAFLAEFSPRKHRGFGCSWLEFGSVAGFLLASFVVLALQTWLTPEDLLSWGWRIPFFLAVPLAFVGLYLRLKIEDTPEYRALEELETVPTQPLKEVFKSNWKQLLQTVGIETFMNATFYIVLVYLATYQEKTLGMTAGQSALLATVASLVAMVIIPLSGAMSDRVGRKPVLFTAAGLLIVTSVPIFLLMKQGSPWAGFLSTFLVAAILAIILGTHAATVSELFPTRTRQSGLSIAYSIAGAFFAGTMPYILTWLVALTNSDLVPAFMLMLLGVIGAVTLFTMPETNGSDLLHEVDKTGGNAKKAVSLSN